MVPRATLCIAGKNRIAVDVLDMALARDRWDVAALPNRGDDGADGWQPSFRKAAKNRSVPVVDLEWAERQPGLCFLSVEFDRLIRPGRFAGSRLFNIHFSLLPKYRGCNTAIWPILNGEQEHGVTLHWIDAGMDSGPIVDRRCFAIDGMTAREVYFRCMAEGAGLIGAWLDRLVEGEVPAIPQNEAQASSYPRSALDFGRTAIDHDTTVEQILRTVRAFHFPEYQLATFGGRGIDRAIRAADAPSAAPGTVIELGPLSSRLWAQDGAVDLTFAGQAD